MEKNNSAAQRADGLTREEKYAILVPVSHKKTSHTFMETGHSMDIWGRNGFDGDVEAGAASRGGRLFKSPNLNIKRQ